VAELERRDHSGKYNPNVAVGFREAARLLRTLLQPATEEERGPELSPRDPRIDITLEAAERLATEEER
jgi:hypothetical protein